jgi:hypothetical protein
MAFNAKQFKVKKKRAVDPNAPPRPNLLSHDKKLREGQLAFDQLQDQVRRQTEELATLRSKVTYLESLVNIIAHRINNFK